MKHLLNICNINGAEVEPVDIITFCWVGTSRAAC